MSEAFPSKIGKRGRMHAIDGRVLHFRVLDEIVREQPITEKPSRKLIYLQKIQFEHSREVQYRFAYWMLGVEPGAKGRWVFGQYAALIPATLLSEILKEAHERSWEGF